MSKVLEVRLTLPEAKAIARLVKIGISSIEADEQPVNNEVTLRRAIAACKTGIEKIDGAIVDAEA